LTAKIVHNEECESFILGIVESACEMLRYKFSFDSSFPCFFTAIFVTHFAVIGTCLDFAAEDRRVTKRNAALEKMSAGFETVTSQDVRLEIERTQKCALHSCTENLGNFPAFK
jgi:hypothetical protein